MQERPGRLRLVVVDRVDNLSLQMTPEEFRQQMLKGLLDRMPWWLRHRVQRAFTESFDQIETDFRQRTRQNRLEGERRTG